MEGGRFVAKDVCVGGRFVEGRFVEEDVLYRRTFCIGGRFVEERSVEGRFVVEDVSWKDVL